MTGVVVLGRSGVRRLATGHPWIYTDHIVSAPEANDAAVVKLEGPPGTPRGFAVHHPGSRLPLRVIARDPSFDPAGDWWADRLDVAIERRVRTLAPEAEACRWVHAEADGLPGLVVDRYGAIAVIQAGCLWADHLAGRIAERLMAHHGITGVLARHDGAFRRPEGLAEEVVILAGVVPEAIEVKQDGCRRVIDPWHGQKTGAFLDQRENQRWAADVLPVGRALDAFCCDGMFAVSLARAGSEVDAIDSSESALVRAVEHARLNDVGDRIRTQRANVFEHLRQLDSQRVALDAIVLDPPALAKRKVQRSSALRAYKDINLRALRLLRPGGRLLTCSCSFHVDQAAFLEVLREAAADVRREVEVVAIRGAANCHPHRLTFPESAYLKVVLLEAR